MARRLDGDFDYIVVGAGTAGCIIANRLSADPSKRVLLLEAGGKDNWIWFHIPVGYLFAIGNPRSDWMFETEKEAGLNGRSLKYPRGKVIGGCSAINAMISMRGQAHDYDHWRQLGLPGVAGRRREGQGDEDHPDVHDHAAVGPADEAAPPVAAGGEHQLATGGATGEAGQEERDERGHPAGAEQHGDHQDAGTDPRRPQQAVT